MSIVPIRSGPNFKTDIVRDKKYRRHVASQPCLVCGRRDVQAAHISIGNYAKGLKAGDDLCVPLCLDHHQEMDAGQDRFIRAHAEQFGLDVVEAVKGIWRENFQTWKESQ